MLSNHLKVAWRNLRKNKGYSLVTTLGLSVAVACCILVGLYVHHELTYESHHAKAERIYRIGQQMEYSGQEVLSNRSPSLLARTLRQEASGVENAARLTRRENTLVEYGDRSFYEDDLFYTEQAVFDMFTVAFLRGSPQEALAAPGSAVISRRMAEKYFGEEDPVGKVITVSEQERQLTVMGIIANPPGATELPFHILANPADNTLQWERISSITSYVLLAPGADTGEVKQQMLALTRANSENPALQGYMLERLDQLHLYAFDASGDVSYLYIFSFAAFFLLLIAVVNHINLSIAQLIPRSREVGVRKAMGARPSQLSLRFLSESFLASLLAVTAALLMVEMVYPLASAIPGVTLSSYGLLDPWLWALLVPLVLVITVLSAAYVTLYLARLDPSAIFRNETAQSSGNSLLRKGLVVFQFAVSIALICSTLIVQNQLDYMMESDLGFDREHVITISLKGEQQQQYEVLKQRMQGVSGVEGVAASGGSVGVSGAMEFTLEEGPFPHFSVLTVDPQFLSLMGIRSLSGAPMNLQEGEWVVNESFARAVNSEEFQGENLGALLGLDALPFQGRITGVVSDFHYRSLHSEIGPLALQIGRDGFNTLNVRLQAGSVGPTLDRLREAWSEVAGGVPMEYTFLDDSIADIYRSSHRFAQIFWAFSLVTIVIACMGLFSLAALAARRRTREIGIRKVLGATTESIVARLSGDFLLQVAVGFLIAAPVAWYAMDRWLADFAYRVEIGIGVFALAGGAALLIALLTVSWQSVRAARANPVESLRSE